jgi:uncharacterized protein YegJ (DUF2314 family)
MLSLARREVLVPVRQDDGELADAIRAAKRSVGEFFAAFENPTPTQSGFQMKVAFEDRGDVEHIWLMNLDLGNELATGVVSNEPRLASLSYRQRIWFDRKRVIDWMYLEDGRMVGGFTTKVMMQGLARRRRDDDPMPVPARAASSVGAHLASLRGWSVLEG